MRRKFLRKNKLHTIFLISILVASLISCKSGTTSQIKAFRFGYLYDSVQNEWLKDQVLLVSEDRIIEVNPQSIPDHAITFDYSFSYVIPGLIDAHTHLFLDDPTLGKDFSEGLLKYTQKTKENERIDLGLKRADSLLKNGFTSVRDLGNHGEVAVKKLSTRSSVKIFTSGKGITPQYGQFPLKTTPEVIFREYAKLSDSPTSAVLIDRDLLKIYADEEPNHSYASLKVLRNWVKFAHQNKMKVAAHAILPQGIDLAIASGADSLEHGTSISPNQLAKMAKNKMIFVPTHGDSLLVHANDPFINQKIARTCFNIKEADRMKVAIAFGSDNYFSLDKFGQSFGEATLQTLLNFHKCGLKSNTVLRAATYLAAKSMGQENWIGVLKKDAAADFIVLKKNPLNDLFTLKSPEAIFSKGQQVK